MSVSNEELEKSIIEKYIQEGKTFAEAYWLARKDVVSLGYAPTICGVKGAYDRQYSSLEHDEPRKMILAIEFGHNVLVKLKDVKDEEEAFYEMRRYLFVNGIKSVTTDIRKYQTYENEYGCIGKSVVMMRWFFIYYDDPVDNAYKEDVLYDSIDDARSSNEEFDRLYKQYLEYRSLDKDPPKGSLRGRLCDKYSYDFQNIKRTDNVNWVPDEYYAYMLDLKDRGGYLCR